MPKTSQKSWLKMTEIQQIRYKSQWKSGLIYLISDLNSNFISDGLDPIYAKYTSPTLERFLKPRKSRICLSQK